MENELKPCVRCESIDTGELSENVPGWFCVVCSLTKGGCGMSTALHEDKQEPVDDWNNTRPNQEDLAEAVELLKESLPILSDVGVEGVSGGWLQLNPLDFKVSKLLKDVEVYLSKRQGGS